MLLRRKRATGPALHFLLRRKWATGLDLHFSFPQRERKIEVETSVCTGHSKCPPDTCIQMGSSPVFLANNKSTPFGVLLLFGTSVHNGLDLN